MKATPLRGGGGTWGQGGDRLRQCGRRAPGSGSVAAVSRELCPLNGTSTQRQQGRRAGRSGGWTPDVPHRET
eukprot:4026724-Pleurochrysis_carterae.AAC.1